MLPTKETLDAGIQDREFRRTFLQGVLSEELGVILKSSYRCDPPTGRCEEARSEFFSEKGLVLSSVHLKPPRPVDGHGPQISCKSDCEQIVLFESGELVTLRTRHYSGHNNVYTYGVGEYIEETRVDIRPLTAVEFDKQRATISQELWGRVCAIAGKQGEAGT